MENRKRRKKKKKKEKEEGEDRLWHKIRYSRKQRNRRKR